MNTKQRSTIFDRWSGVIRRETRDLASLQAVGGRALADPDVRGDATLRSLIETELQNRRAQLAQESSDKEVASAQTETRITSRSEPPAPVPITDPKEDRANFDRLARDLSASLEQGDERSTRTLLSTMFDLHERRPGLIPATVLEDYARQVEELAEHVKRLKDEIEVLKKRAVVASRRGKEQDLVRSMRRLAAIHAAHPGLLDAAGLEDIRHHVAEAAEERREYKLTTEKLIERERAITAEIRVLAGAVREFRRVACAVPDNTDEFRRAEAAYLRAIQKVRAYDTEWFSGVVLEMADLLAEWPIPPMGAEHQIDRFLDGVEAGLGRIRAEIRGIENVQDSEDKNASGPSGPRP